jgi:polar amino acid transport system substrate-binding protein
MQKTKFIVITIFVIITTVFPAMPPSAADSADTLDIGSVYRPPLSNEDGTGMIDLIVKEAFSRIGVKIHIIRADRKQALEKANKGLYDGDIMRVAGTSLKYPNLFQVPESFYENEYVAFSKTVNTPMTGWEGLKPYRVAIPEGSVEIGRNVTEQNTKSVVKIVSPFDMFNMIRKGEADLVIYERLMGYEQIREGEMSDIHVLEPSFSKKQMYLYLHNKHQDLIPKLAAAISNMKKDGTIQKISDQTLGKYKK